MNKGIRVFWDADKGWTCEAPFALSRLQAEAVVKWVKKVQGERLRAASGLHRDRRAQMEGALGALTAATLHQVVSAAPNAEFSLFQHGKLR